ncbi:MAG: radical SAM protein, partial [Bacteroidales bacterium]|nr:radical SAM protein [Bacteroidales bacterium]
MKTKHYTIPIFIPELACPFRCIYCDQHKITGKTHLPGPEEVKEIIEKHLASFPKRKKEVEIGFFGGNFTGIPIEEQRRYLGVAVEYLREGKVQGIRLSTRPDYINEQVIKLLKTYKVTTVELGAQSMVDEVLQASSRGHTVADTVKASEMIRAARIRLGLQMMIGLPGDKPEYDLQTASAFVELEADDARIYP